MSRHCIDIMKKTIVFKVPDFKSHELLQGSRKMTAFRFPEKLIKSFEKKSKDLGLQKTALLEMAMISIIEKGEVKK